MADRPRETNGGWPHRATVGSRPCSGIAGSDFKPRGELWGYQTGEPSPVPLQTSVRPSMGLEWNFVVAIDFFTCGRMQARHIKDTMAEH